MMDAIAPETLTNLCKDLEAFETPRWAIERMLEVEILTRHVVDPCSGTGIIPAVLDEKGYTPIASDIKDWAHELPRSSMKWPYTPNILDWLADVNTMDLTGMSVVMNPPFSLACQFVDKAKALGARKIVCFQRQAWREGQGRKAWWDVNPPSRVWVCGSRASCWRFDLLECQSPEGEEFCKNTGRCQYCSGGVPTSHAWYVYEHGHRGIEATGAIYK